MRTDFERVGSKQGLIGRQWWTWRELVFSRLKFTRGGDSMHGTEIEVWTVSGFKT
jgi:hypothetical protein